MDVHKVMLSREDLANLRMMLRVISVQRYAEVIASAHDRRPGAQLPTTAKSLHDILRYTDAYRIFDHHLMTAIETCILTNMAETEIGMTGPALKFYRDILNYEFENGLVRSQVYTDMVKACQLAQAMPMKARIIALADQILGPLPVPEKPKDSPPVAVNMAPATGKN